MADLSSEQIKAARALLRWSQADLAEASKVSLPTVQRVEKTPGQARGYDRTIESLKGALEAAGVEFTGREGGGPGVRLVRVYFLRIGGELVPEPFSTLGAAQVRGISLRKSREDLLIEEQWFTPGRIRSWHYDDDGECWVEGGR